jgi:deoxyribodipyrimidine photo-lyase
MGFNREKAKQIIDRDVAVFWMRRDLRLKDNAAFYHALKENKKVIPLFIFDTKILDELDDKKDKRVEFILQSLSIIQEELAEQKSSLLILHGNPTEIFQQLNPKSVYTNRDYESYARKRDSVVGDLLAKKNILFNTYKDHVIFEKDEVLKKDGTPYTIFTPYSKIWKETLNLFYIKPYPSEKYLTSLLRTSRIPLPSLEEIGFKPTGSIFPKRTIPGSIIRKYDKTRNFPAVNGTSRLSVHLRFGTVSIRQLVKFALKSNETWLNELIWREFYSMILWHFPHVEHGSFKPAYDHIDWRNNEQEFRLWCEGKTGFPMVDAGMRELNNTGFMHNRVRMITASFLTKDLLIDWRWGEAYFAKKLIDYELASNNGGWQWAAGSGCDSAPYFRIFNPSEQQKKFDSDFSYIKKWVPELGTALYPQPIVDHAFARDRTLKTYKAALSNLS